MIAASEPATPVLVSQVLETPWMGPGSTELLLNPQIPPPTKACNSRPTPTVNSQPEQGAGQGWAGAGGGVVGRDAQVLPLKTYHVALGKMHSEPLIPHL